MNALQTIFGEGFRLLNPEWLLLWLLLPVLWLIARRKERASRAALRFSTVQPAQGAPRSWTVPGRHVVKLLRLIALAFLIFALARPQQGQSNKRVRAEGIAIALVVDCSGSMEHQDFKPNRLEAAKRVLEEFVDGRENDQICVVIYGNSSFVACPMTMDYDVLKDFVRRINFQMLGEQFTGKTAIGLGLAHALNQLQQTGAESKVAILLTDGKNNAGEEMPPLKAADLAKTLGVKVYTIGMGDPNARVQPQGFGFFQMTMQGSELDEELLAEIAQKTGGRYFRATNGEKLEEIYAAINKMEKKEFELPTFDSYDEKMGFWAALGLALLMLELLLGYTRFLKLP
ncbi:VWA domain-containing protein [Candidatus Sumerlaeota bacterium]|nr:VWA domain-containing protein [Candidatus Sumerlaeota bacterium]